MMHLSHSRTAIWIRHFSPRLLIAGSHQTMAFDTTCSLAHQDLERRIIEYLALLPTPLEILQPGQSESGCYEWLFLDSMGVSKVLVSPSSLTKHYVEFDLVFWCGINMVCKLNVFQLSLLRTCLLATLLESASIGEHRSREQVPERLA
jgi:hypothetical protein